MVSKFQKILLAGIALVLLVAVGVKSLQPEVSAPSPAASPTPAAAAVPNPSAVSAGLVHDNITATVFWVGEDADSDNDFIHNRSSAWIEDWEQAYGGVDSDEDRCGYIPCGFIPKENSFYFALPFNDYDAKGNARPASVLSKIPWYSAQPQPNTSLLKNRWVKITYGSKTVYAQWEDVGPFNEDDVDYVFGTNRPRETRAGIDLSPATAGYLGVDGSGQVSWQFVERDQVPGGPWKTTITASGLKY